MAPCPSSVNVTHVSFCASGGGAAIACDRIHRALLRHGADHGVRSRLRLRHGHRADDPSRVVGPPQGSHPLWRRLQPRLTALARRGFASAHPMTHSIAWPATGLGQELGRDDSDLIHLHWLGDQTLSIEEIGALPRPLVWTLHDQWAFCGAEHCENTALPGTPRHEQGYRAGNRPAGERGPDLCRRTWERKRRSWRQPFTVVCPSQWMAGCVGRSALMRHWPSVVIPHPIDTTLWRPIDRGAARAALGLPADGQVLLFSAMGGTQVPHKGGDLLLDALQQLARAATDGLADLRLLIAGQATPRTPLALPLAVQYEGILHDPVSMRLLYSAADVVVVPSRIEAFGQVALEAQACGTAVVAFATGGLSDIVADRSSGALAKAGDSSALAAAIRWVLDAPERPLQLGAEGRRRVTQQFAEAVVARRYADLYHSLLGVSRPPS